MENVMLVTAPTLATLTIEVVKLLVRKYIVKNMEFDFPVKFYSLVIPLITFLWQIVLGYAGWADPVQFTVQSLVQWVVAVVLTLCLYALGIKPAKEYLKEH